MMDRLWKHAHWLALVFVAVLVAQCVLRLA